jgi:hypothetical protein
VKRASHATSWHGTTVSPLLWFVLLLSASAFQRINTSQEIVGKVLSLKPRLIWLLTVTSMAIPEFAVPVWQSVDGNRRRRRSSLCAPFFLLEKAMEVKLPHIHA